ncbi:MAG: hypothetical protein H3Z50_00930 [archaeon]|nr:hypothetical protein [archaeon]MCP8306397.1 hypothetical protein [archaeon]
MPTFSVNMKHTVESCPLFNPETKKKFKEVIGKRGEAAEKHGVKVLSAWTSILNHLIFYIVEAPSQKAVEDYFIEIGFAFWNNLEIRQVKLVEDVLRGIEKS